MTSLTLPSLSGRCSSHGWATRFHLVATILILSTSATFSQVDQAPLPVGVTPGSVADELLAGTTFIQFNGAPRSKSSGTLSSPSIGPSGGNDRPIQAGRAAGLINVADYGAKCDGTTDDAVAFNAALAVVRAQVAVSGTLAWPVGRAGLLTAPGGQCVIKSSLNLTGLYGSGFSVDLRGTVLLCQVAGNKCLDAIGLGNARLEGLSIVGSCIAGNIPTIGLALGRITNNSVGADHNYIDQPTITGCFTVASYYNNQSETTLVIHATFLNQQAAAYGAIWDGSNHFNVQSSFTGKVYPPNNFMSFNENSCIECTIGVFGASSVPVWIGGTARHSFPNNYWYYSSISGNSPAPALRLYFAPGLTNDYLNLDVHFEDFGGKKNLNHLIQFTGTLPNPVVHGLRIRDNYPEQTGSVFAMDGSVTSVGIQNLDAQIGTMPNSKTWWDIPSAYTISGHVYSQDATYSLPGVFSGTSCSGSICTTR